MIGLTNTRRLAIIGAATAFVLALGAQAVAQEVTLKAVTGLPKTHFFIKSFGKLVEKINAAGKGVLQINWVGGPEVTPGTKQAQALRRGVFDIVYGPGSYYQGIVPEVNAILGANISPMEARKNGGMALLDEAWNKRLGAHFLAWPQGRVGYTLFLKSAPRRTADGGISVDGKKIRGNPTYRPLINAVGGTLIAMPPSEIQTALERGLVAGLGFVNVSYAKRGWSRHVKFMVDPPVMRVSLVMMVNRKKFDSMPKKAQAFLEKMALDHERETYEGSIREIKAEREAALKQGIKIIKLTGAARKKWVDGALDGAWAKLKKLSPDNADALRAKFQK